MRYLIGAACGAAVTGFAVWAYAIYMGYKSWQDS